MDNVRAEFYQNVFENLAKALPAIVAEYACTFPDFLASDLTWLEKPDVFDPTATRSWLLWKGRTLLEMVVETSPQFHCQCLLNYPNTRH